MESVDKLKKRRDILSDYLRDLLEEVASVNLALDDLNKKINDKSPLLSGKNGV